VIHRPHTICRKEEFEKKGSSWPYLESTLREEKVDQRNTSGRKGQRLWGYRSLLPQGKKLKKWGRWGIPYVRNEIFSQRGKRVHQSLLLRKRLSKKNAKKSTKDSLGGKGETRGKGGRS